MNQPNYFEIQASDPEKLIAFYSKVFNWVFTKQEGMPVEFWHITTEGIAGGLLKRPAAVPGTEQGANAFVVSMQVVSFDQTVQNIISQGGVVALPKFAVPGKCWQGYFIDTDNNTFGIFEADPKAH